MGPTTWRAVPDGLIGQEVRMDSSSTSPRRCATCIGLAPDPADRARRLGRLAPRRDLLQVRGRSPAGCTSRTAQAFYNAEEGAAGSPRRPVPANGDPRWRSPPVRSRARSGWSRVLRPEAVSPLMSHWPPCTPAPRLDRGRRSCRRPDSPGSLGIAISEAVEVAARRHPLPLQPQPLLSTDVIGEEALEPPGARPGRRLHRRRSNFGGLASLPASWGR